MQLLSYQEFLGANIYGRYPICVLHFDSGEPERGFVGRQQLHVIEKLAGLFPALAGQQADNLMARLNQGQIVHVHVLFEKILLELLQTAGTGRYDVEIKTAENTQHCYLVLDYKQFGAERIAANLALDIMRALLASNSESGAFNAIDIKAGIEKYHGYVEYFQLDRISAALVNTAQQFGIPWRRLIEGDSYVQLGEGRYRKLIYRAATEHTSMLGSRIAREKSIANKILDNAGFPVPEQKLVGNKQDAVNAAMQMTYPVVIKPMSTDRGKGVHPNINKLSHLSKAYEDASQYGLVVVEKFIAGDEHRLLVINGSMIAASKRLPAHVFGNGRDNVEQLVKAVNEQRSKQKNVLIKLHEIQLNEFSALCLRTQGHSLSSIPKHGEMVRLTEVSNVAVGGQPVDVTEQVHPDNQALAIRACALLGLDVGGVDFITEDISRSYMDVGGGICEVNYFPGIYAHWITEQKKHDVCSAYIQYLYPPGANSRMSIAAIAGDKGETFTVLMLAYLLKAAGACVGSASKQGLHIDGRQISKVNSAGLNGAKKLILDTQIDSAVIAYDSTDLYRNGMDQAGCDVAMILNCDVVGAENIENKLLAMRVLVKAARNAVVINADDASCCALLADVTVSLIILVSENEDTPEIQKHVSTGGATVFLRSFSKGAAIVYKAQGNAKEVFIVDELFAVQKATQYEHVSELLLICASAIAMGMDCAIIGQALLGYAKAT